MNTKITALFSSFILFALLLSLPSLSFAEIAINESTVAIQAADDKEEESEDSEESEETKTEGEDDEHEGCSH